jgi:hypothetical protein
MYMCKSEAKSNGAMVRMCRVTKRRSRETTVNRTSSDPRIQMCLMPTATITKPRTPRVHRPSLERTSKTSDARASATRCPSCDAQTPAQLPREVKCR